MQGGEMLQRRRLWWIRGALRRVARHRRPQPCRQEIDGQKKREGRFLRPGASMSVLSGLPVPVSFNEHPHPRHASTPQSQPYPSPSSPSADHATRSYPWACFSCTSST